MGSSQLWAHLSCGVVSPLWVGLLTNPLRCGLVSQLWVGLLTNPLRCGLVSQLWVGLLTNPPESFLEKAIATRALSQRELTHPDGCSRLHDPLGGCHQFSSNARLVGRVSGIRGNRVV
jgi:hypothetical protein